MDTIQHNLERVRQQIEAAAHACDRPSSEITLLAVSKTKPVSAIEEALQAGQTAFGENYVQEGVDKILHFANTSWARALEWHFIGPLQSNKSRLVAEHFHWMQTLDRYRIAQRLNEQRPANLPPLNVLIQINISDEESKSGIPPTELDALAAEIVQLPRLTLRGLMAIPAASQSPQQQRATFEAMQRLFRCLQAKYPQVDTLSMGMTDDMPAAIAAGSNMVRIGTAIFGARQYANPAVPPATQ